MASLDVDIVRRFTGQTRVTSEEVAVQELRSAEQALMRADASHKALGRRLESARASARWHATRIALARLPERIGIEGWALLLIAAAALGLALSLTLVFGLSCQFGLALGASLSPFVLLAVAPLIFPRDRGFAEAKLVSANKLLAATLADRRMTAAMVGRCRERCAQAEQLYRGILAARDYPLNRLLSAHPGSMSGDEFERFLEEVFSFLGYRVVKTGKAGDHGADLIVGRGALLLAVQAKCYSDSVGNAAIQQAFTAMRIYGCHACAVITSARFTRQAIADARSVGCLLVSGDKIPQLIRGHIPLL